VVFYLPGSFGSHFLACCIDSALGRISGTRWGMQWLLAPGSTIQHQLSDRCTETPAHGCCTFKHGETKGPPRTGACFYSIKRLKVKWSGVGSRVASSLTSVLCSYGKPSMGSTVWHKAVYVAPHCHSRTSQDDGSCLGLSRYIYTGT